MLKTATGGITGAGTTRPTARITTGATTMRLPRLTAIRRRRLPHITGAQHIITARPGTRTTAAAWRSAPCDLDGGNEIEVVRADAAFWQLGMRIIRGSDDFPAWLTPVWLTRLTPLWPSARAHFRAARQPVPTAWPRRLNPFAAPLRAA